jgi:hypothetical protein
MLPVASRGILGVVGKPPGKVVLYFYLKKKKEFRENKKY